MTDNKQPGAPKKVQAPQAPQSSSPMADPPGGLSTTAAPSLGDHAAARALDDAAAEARRAAALELMQAEDEDPSEQAAFDGVAADDPRGVDESVGPALRGHIRVPMGSQAQQLQLPQRQGFHRHWFNDRPGRIQMARNAGYEHIKDKSGRPIARTVGIAERGGGLNAYAMEIPLEWHKEYQEAKQRRLDEEDGVINRGKFRADASDNRYVPKDTPIRMRSVRGGTARGA